MDSVTWLRNRTCRWLSPGVALNMPVMEPFHRQDEKNDRHLCTMRGGSTNFSTLPIFLHSKWKLLLVFLNTSIKIYHLVAPPLRLPNDCLKFAWKKYLLINKRLLYITLFCYFKILYCIVIVFLMCYKENFIHSHLNFIAVSLVAWFKTIGTKTLF